VVTFRATILRTGFSCTGFGRAGETQSGSAVVSGWTLHSAPFWNADDRLLSSFIVFRPFFTPAVAAIEKCDNELPAEQVARTTPAMRLSLATIRQLPQRRDANQVI
jgi:hypothetical protein